MTINPGGHPATPPPAAPAIWAGDPAGRVLKLLGKDHLGPDVIQGLASMGGEIIPLLGSVATGERPADPYQQENALYVLGMLGQDSAVPALARVLWGSDPNLQLLAARALGRIGSPAALAELRRLYNGYQAPAADGLDAGPDADPGATLPAPDQPAAVRRALAGWGQPAAPRPMPPALALELRDILGYSASNAMNTAARSRGADGPASEDSHYPAAGDLPSP